MTDDTLRGPEDYQQFTIAAPQDPRLPGGGGYPITLSMVTAAAAGRGTQNYVTFETDFGPERDLVLARGRFHGERAPPPGADAAGRDADRPVDRGHLRDRTRARRDGRGAGVPWMGQTLTNLATIKDLRNCRDVDPFQTTVRGLASYTIPKVDVLVSATVRSQPALERVATWQVPNTVIQSIIGRLPPGGLATGNTNIEILDTDHRLYADNRRTQIDMRFAKIFRFGPRRVDVGVDLGNLLNTNYATTYENTYQYSAGNTATGGTWNNPTAIYTAAVRPLEPDGRLLRCSVASARRRHLCSARTSRSRKSTAIL